MSNTLALIVSWFGIGFISIFLGMLSDYVLYKRKPKISIMHYIVCILAGYGSMFILFKSVLNGIIKKR